MLPAPLLKALAYVIGVLVSLVPAVAPAGLFPEDAQIADGEAPGDGFPQPIVGDIVVTDPTADGPPREARPVEGQASANESAGNDSADEPPPPAIVRPKNRTEDAPPFVARWRTPKVETSPGGVVPLTLVVENRHEWHLSVAVRLKDVTHSWDGGIQEDRLEIEPGESVHVAAFLEAPTTATPGTVGRLRVDLSTPFPPTVQSVAAEARIPIPEVRHAVSLFNNGDNLYATPGDTVNYTLTVANIGDAVDSFGLSFPAGSNGWGAALSRQSVRLQPGEATEVTLAVTAPENAGDGEGQFFNVTARSQSNPQAAAVATTLTVADAEQSGLPLLDLEVVCFRLPPESDRAGDAVGTSERVCIDARPFLAAVPQTEDS